MHKTAPTNYLYHTRTDLDTRSVLENESWRNTNNTLITQGIINTYKALWNYSRLASELVFYFSFILLCRSYAGCSVLPVWICFSKRYLVNAYDYISKSSKSARSLRCFSSYSEVVFSTASEVGSSTDLPAGSSTAVVSSSRA